MNRNGRHWWIVGSSSTVGRALVASLDQNDIDFTSLGRTHDARAERKIDLDLDDLDSTALPDVATGDVVILLAAVSDPFKCVDDMRSLQINVLSLAKLIDHFQSADAAIVFLSSEYVYSNSTAVITEDTVPAPTCAYGMHKLLVEKYLQKKCPSALVFRCGKMFSKSELDKGHIRNLYGALEESELVCATDQIMAPIFLDDVCASIIEGVNRELSGTFNLVGPQWFSRYKLAESLAYFRKSRSLESSRLIEGSFKSLSLGDTIPYCLPLSGEKWRKVSSVEFTDVLTFFQGVR